MIIALFPYCSKNLEVLSTYSFLNILESSFLNNLGPTLKPIQYPVKLPKIPAKVINSKANPSGTSISPVAINNPVAKSKESPGKKKPISSPHSAKTIINTTTKAHCPAAVKIFSGFKKLNGDAGIMAPRWVILLILAIRKTSYVNPFELPQKSVLVLITDPFEKVALDETLFDLVIRTSSANSAREDIAAAVFNICMNVPNDSPIALVAHERSGTLLPGIGSGLRASYRKLSSYIFIDANLPTPNPVAPPNAQLLEHYFDSVPLTEDWPNAPVIYLKTKTESDIWAQQVKVRGWQLIEKDLTTGIKSIRNFINGETDKN